MKKLMILNLINIDRNLKNKFRKRKSIKNKIKKLALITQNNLFQKNNKDNKEEVIELFPILIGLYNKNKLNKRLFILFY